MKKTAEEVPLHSDFGNPQSYRTIRVAKSVRLLPGTERGVLVHEVTAGVFFMQAHERLFRLSRVAGTNGLVDIQSGKPFTIMAGNFGPGLACAHEGQILGTLVPFAANGASVAAAPRTEEL